MGWALVSALAAGVCYGLAVVLQGLATRRQAVRPGADSGLLLRLLRDTTYLASLALDGAGFVLGALAQRQLPLFLVQAALCGYVAVAAVLSAPVLGVRLTTRERFGVAGLVAALTGLAVTAAPATQTHVSTGVRLLLTAAAVLVLAAAPLALRSSRVGAMLAVLAGLQYAVIAVAVRSIGSTSVPRVLLDPALWALVIAGLGSLQLFAQALQHASVTVVTGLAVVVETLVPAAVGVVWLGDGARAGLVVPAVVCFVAAVAAALSLAGHGAEAAQEQPPPAVTA